jgi:hypothetical protein
MASFQDRVLGAIRLNPQTFEEVEHDQTATTQAGLVVLAAAVSAGIATRSVSMLLGGVVLGLIGWVIVSFLILVIGTRLLPGRNTEADLGQLLRVVGFAQAIGLFSILAIIPYLGDIIRIVVNVWILVAFVIGIRQALDYDDTLRAVIVCVLAWAVSVAISLIATCVGVGSAMVGSRIL